MDFFAAQGFLSKLVWPVQDIERLQQAIQAIEKQPSHYADVLHALGLCYYHGVGTEQSFEKAFAKFERASAKGHVKSQNYLGVMCEKGQGTEQNYARAVEMYRKAGESGNLTEAKFNLARMYVYGFGVEKDVEAGLHTMREMAEFGHLRAQLYLAKLLKSGDESLGIEEDFSEYFEWLKKAADLGHQQSQYEVAVIQDENMEDYDAAAALYVGLILEGHVGAYKRLLALSGKIQSQLEELLQQGLHGNFNSVTAGRASIEKLRLFQSNINDTLANTMDKFYGQENGLNNDEATPDVLESV